MTGVGGTTRHKPRGFGRWSLHEDTDSANLHLCSDAPEIRSRRRFPLPRPSWRRRGLRLTQSGGLLAALLSLPVDQIKKRKKKRKEKKRFCSHGLKITYSLPKYSRVLGLLPAPSHFTEGVISDCRYVRKRESACVHPPACGFFNLSGIFQACVNNMINVKLHAVAVLLTEM